MKNHIVICTMAYLAFVGNAGATSLQNKDAQKYDIRVIGSSTMTTSIDGGMVKTNICRKSCTIEVKNIGSINAGGSDKIIIKNGKLEKR